jgi:UDP-N-acetylmuramyl pentapeptide phosphotransferase/UDP-N-acetylglucosamine-1-phosphate transferase
MNSSVEAWRLLREAGTGLLILPAIATACLILLLRPLLQRYALARPNVRSSHKVPTPQGGGIAVIGVTLIAVAIAVMAFPEFSAGGGAALATVLGAATVLAVMGAIDDIHVLGAVPRLLLQILVVSAVIAALPSDLRIVPWLPWWIERSLLLVAMVWFVNLVNFMDGADWMTVAEVVPVTAGLVLLGLLGALPPQGVMVALALCGAVLGFAPFNRPVAKLFLGDVGSLPIGLLIAWLLVLVAANGHLTAAVLLPLYYLADATLTLMRRLLNRERIWQAHRSHFYQRAHDGGFTVSQIVGCVFAVNVALMILAALTVRFSSLAADLMALTLGVAMVGWLLVRFARARDETPSLT